MDYKLNEIVLFHRKKSGLSRNLLADLAGVGKTVIYDIEKGKETIQFSTLRKVFTPLNIRFFEYLAKERLALTQKSIAQTKNKIINALPKWVDFIQICFLSDTMKTKYLSLLKERLSKLELS